MSSPLAKAKAKRARRPIYLLVRKLVDPETGELVGALVPANMIDQRLLRERKFNVGREVRAELKQSRNPAFHRLAHALGHLLVDNVDGFEALVELPVTKGTFWPTTILPSSLSRVTRFGVERIFIESSVDSVRISARSEPLL